MRAVITSSMKRLYESPGRMNAPAFVDRVATSGHAMGAARLVDMRDAVVMLRSSLLGDFTNKGVQLAAEDACGVVGYYGFGKCSPRGLASIWLRSLEI